VLDVADWKKLVGDAVSQIGEAAQAAGQGLRQAAGEAGKVVGIGVGSIELRTARSTYRLGQTIHGVVSLRLEEPTAASGLMVALRATRRRLVHAGQGSSYQDEVVHEFSVGLGGEETYESGEHPFAIELPRELDMRSEAGGVFGQAVAAARAFKSMTEAKLRWRLVVTLVIPWKRNLSKAFGINVFEEVGEPEDTPPPPGRTRSSSRDAAAPPKQAPNPPPEQGPATPPKAETKPPPRQEPASSPKHEPAPPPPKQEPAPPPKNEPTPPPEHEPVLALEPIALPGGWALALSRMLCALQGQGWVVIHSWAGAPVRPEVVYGALARHPDLDPEILLLYGVMDGLQLVVGKPLVPRGEYEAVRLARELSTRDGGPIGALGEFGICSGMGAPLTAEFVTEGRDAVRVLELPTLERLLDDCEDFMHRDGHNVIFGAIVRGYADFLGIVRADELRRWRQPASGTPGRPGYYDHHARTYQARLSEREREHPGQTWWVVRGKDHGAALREPPLLLRWSEMLALCLHELEHGPEPAGVSR
jgi:hypothetical protein